ncbi:MAG: hypothetical protein KGO49_09275 [Gammaproteobacteria bacterium]|nr:hypothetical protein [Gammaproteobacteria bacterium]
MPPAQLIIWDLGKAVQSKKPYHISFFSGNGLRLLKGNAQRWWSITIRLHQNDSVTNVGIRPQEKITMSQLFDLILETIKEDVSAEEISAASDIDAIIAVCSAKPTS